MYVQAKPDAARMAVLWCKASRSCCSWLLRLWLLSTLSREVASQTLGCVAGTQDYEKLLTCDGCPARNDTIWCLNETARVVQNPWTGCFRYGEGYFNNTGRRTPLFINDLEVTETGKFWLPADAVNDRLRGAIFNCTTAGETGGLCQSEFEFVIFGTDVNSPPSLPVPQDPNIGSIIGRQEILCFKVQSPDTNGTVYWQVGSAEMVPAVGISSGNCGDCNCVEKAFLPAIMASPSQLPHYSAFYAPVFEFTDSLGCQPDVSNHVLSFLLIDAVTSTDSGNYSLTIFSVTGRKNEDGLQFSVNASYATVDPEFHHPTVARTIEININSNHSFLCNATTSRGAVLFWEIVLTQQEGELGTVFEPGEAAKLDGALDEATLRNLCRERSSDRFTVSLGQREVIAKEIGAAVWVQQTALVICNAHANFSASYSCRASDSDRHRSSSLVLDVVLPSPGPQGSTVSTWIIAVAVVFGLIALVAVVGIACTILKFHRQDKLQYNTIPPLVIRITNPNIEEFPRDRLELKEIIGEGQFGQVWRALAEGICPDSSRNVVAVKTIKPNARPSDQNDLLDELRIMQTMEPHPNIVNFLGNCSATESEPLLILMEFAVYGSLKSYLVECRTSSSPARLQAPPQATPQHLASLAGSAVHLCSYHQQQLQHLQGLGDYPNLHTSDSSSQLSLADSVSLAQARRLLRLLRSDYSYRYYSDDYHSPEDQAKNTEARENPAFAYNRLAPNYLSSNYDRLAPLVAGGGCAYRPCFEDPYHYPPPKGGERDYLDYYNQSECECMHSPVLPPSSVSLSQEEIEPREKTPPLVVAKQEALMQPHSPRRTSWEESSHLLSPSYTNVPEPEAERQSMVSLPDGYIYSPSSMCTYCSLQLGATVGVQQEVELGAEQEAGPRERQAAERQAVEDSDSPLAAGGLAYFDVLDFGLQIARGMEHLEKMQCIHRDLAARNVLIAEGFLLKIGDFGLTRDLSDRDYYRKITPGRLPVRWMSMESLHQRVHNYKSDVWSYGVVLWEILTLGGLPYGRSPVAHGCESLVKYLQGGHRLPRPPGANCTDELYNLMLQCWHGDPNIRPSFTELISTFDNFLSLAHGYLRVNPDADGQTVAQEAPSPGAAGASDTTTLALSTSETVPSESGSATVYVLQNGRPQPYLEPKPSATSGKPLLNQNISLATNSSSSPATSPDSVTHLLPSSLPTGTPLPSSPTSKPSGACHRQIQVISKTLQLHPDCLETEV